MHSDSVACKPCSGILRPFEMKYDEYRMPGTFTTFIKILNPYVFYDEDMPERYMKHAVDVLSQGEKKKK